jgi:hypothetical protein
MKNLLLIIPIAYFLSGCQKHTTNTNVDCGCNKYQVCNSGLCQCSSQWAEGDTCTPMRNKFIGTYFGYLYFNGANPQADTITFAVKPNTPDNFLYATQGNFGIYMRFSIQVNYFTDYPTSSTSSKEIDSGVGLLSADYKTLTLTYLPIISPGIIDSTNQYTFIGTRQ